MFQQPPAMYSISNGPRAGWRLETLIMTGDWTRSSPQTMAPRGCLLNQTSTANHWITLRLVGVKSNRDAIGAQVRISTSTGDQFATVTTSSSYQSSSDKRLHFGLGTANSIREIEIRWPSGIHQIVIGSKPDQILTITEPVK